jgi:hypothetical protein
MEATTETQYSIEIDFEAWAAEWEVRMDKLIAAAKAMKDAEAIETSAPVYRYGFTPTAAWAAWAAKIAEVS